METPPRRPPPIPRGRCLLGGELALPLASPISDRLSTRWRRDENSDAMVLNSPIPKLPQPLVIEDVFNDGAAGRIAQPQQLARSGEASPLQVESTAAEPAAGRRVRGGETVRKDTPASPVRRSLRIMGLQKFTNEVESTPVKQQVGKPRGGRPGLRSRSTGIRRQPLRRRTPKRNSANGDRKAGMGPVTKRHREL